MTIEGATNTEVFHAYVREILVPALRPGDIVVMDNLGAHKNEHTLDRIRRKRPAGLSITHISGVCDQGFVGPEAAKR